MASFLSRLFGRKPRDHAFERHVGGARRFADLVDGALRGFLHLLFIQAGVEHDAAVGHRRERERLHHADGDQLGFVQLGEGEGGLVLPESSPTHGKTAIDGKPTAYVCIGPQCSLPATEPAELVETVKAARQVVVA